MATQNNVHVSDDLMTAVAEVASSEGRTPDEVIEEATRRYLARQRLDRLVRKNEERAGEMGITESDVPRIVEEFRREERGGR